VVEQQVEVEVFAVDDETFLPLDECKAPAQLEDEGFQLAQDGGFQVAFIMALAQAQKVEEIRVLEHQARFCRGRRRS
jgi:hypothetical protein